jgi:hypothetical protein
MERGAFAETADPSWRPWFQAGAVAALLAVILFRPHLSAELSLLHGLGLIRWVPTPGSPLEWLTLLRNQPLLALLLLDVGDLVHYVLLIAASACLVSGAPSFRRQHGSGRPDLRRGRQAPGLGVGGPLRRCEG